MLTLPILASLLILTPGYGDQPNKSDSFKSYEGKIISSIKIVRHDVFDDKIREHTPFYYRWGNALHIVTREKIIKDELLFSIGDPVDSLDIIQSQRNLRQRGFIGEVWVSATANGPDSVDITVTTVDYWTTKISLYSELGGGNYTIGAAASEVNFLGYGQSVEIAGQNGTDVDSYSMYLADQRIAGSRISGNFYYTNTTLGDGFTAYLARPQYSLKIKTGYRAKYAETDGIARLFSGGSEVFRYQKLYRVFDSKAVYSIGTLRRLDLFAKYNYEMRDYSPDDPGSPLNSIIPGDETRSYPSIGIGMSLINYDLQRYLDEAGTPEDLTLGAAIRLSIGRSADAFGADYVGTKPELYGRFLVNPLERLFIGGRNTLYWWYHRGRNEEIRNQSELMMYLKTGETNVLSARWLADFAWRQKSTFQIILGGTNGLRGYPVYQFSGTRATIGNLEYRFYIPLEILTVRIGGAAFFDIGNVWKRGENISLDDLHSDVGVGLRFGLTKSSTSRILRLDVAKSLSNNDVFVSFGSNVLFSLRSLDNHD